MLFPFQNHATITKRLKARFSQFTEKWRTANVSKVQETQCTDWMLGKLMLENSQVAAGGGSNSGSSSTVVCKENDVTRTPYFLYNRYKVLKGAGSDR